ncbi:MAG: nucleotidyltransferase domain-containing protein [Campylobacterales bacterium]|nr:nucleotidyltransferase domain-containing protein [Campylobacterales bacterium]
MNIGLKEELIKKIKDTLKQNSKVQSVILFGSRAKGVAKNGSDIDLAIVGDGIDFKDLCKMGAKLDELDLPYKIDIINYNSIANEELKEHIDRVGICL